MKTKDKTLSGGQWVALALALLVLNAALTFGNVWPTLRVVPRAELSIELALLLLALVAWTSFVRPLGTVAHVALTLLMLAWLLGRYAEVTAPALYGRPVNLYWDSQHLPKVAAMLAEVGPWWLVGLIVVAVVALFGALISALALLENNPFPQKPPRYLRAVLFEYHFTDFAMRHATGDWWRRERKGLYCPELSLRQNSQN